MAMGVTICKSCGLRWDAADGDPPARLVVDLDLLDLAKFVAGEFDAVKCGSCRRPLEIRPAVGVLLADAPELLLHPPSDAGREETVAALQRSGHVPPGTKATMFQDLIQLHVAVRGRLRQRSRLIEALIQAAKAGDIPAFAAAHRAELTASWFATAILAVGGGVPGVKIGRLDGVDGRDQLLSLLAHLQRTTWIAVARPWLEGHAAVPLLEEELRRRVDGPAIKEAVVLLDQWVDTSSGSETWQAQGRYAVGAVRASVHAAAGSVNPDAAGWTSDFFGLEVAARTPRGRADAKVQSLLISAARARRTIPFEEAWDACTARVQNARGQDDLQRLGEVGAKAGHDGLCAWVMAGTVWRDPSGEVDADGVLEAVRQAAAGMGSTDGMFEAVRLAADLFAERRQVDQLERLADGLVAIAGGDRNAEAEAEAMLGRYFKVLGLPERLLARIGRLERDWENSLDPRVRLKLWIERSNSLRLVGETRAALRIASAVADALPADTDPDVRRTVHLNLAILLRESGAPDLALGLLASAVEGAPPHQLIEFLFSFTATYGELGNYSAALASVDRGLEIAAGPLARWAARLKFYRASLLGADGQLQRAAQALLDCPAPADTDELLAEAATWVNLLEGDGKLPGAMVARLNGLPRRIKAAVEEDSDVGNVDRMLRGLRVMAHLAEMSKSPAEAERFWAACVSEAREHGRPPDAVELVHLARHAYARGDVAAARGYLTEVPAAVASQFGHVYDLAAAAGGTRRLRGATDRLVRHLVEGSVSAQDARLALEVQRDVIGRGRLAARRAGDEGAGLADLSAGLGDDVVGAIRPESGAVGVVEWFRVEEGIAAMLTVVHSDGRVVPRLLEAMPADPAPAAGSLMARLQGWQLGLPDDPFDVPDWTALAGWMRRQTADGRLGDGDHVVFVEHSRVVNLPWHVAVSPRLTASYAAGWSAILAAHAGDANAARRGPLALARVDRYRESRIVAEAFRASAARTQQLAARLGVPYTAAEGVECDAGRFQDKLRSSEVFKVLCHGYVDPAEKEVAFMLAAGGALPAADSVASGTASGRRHRLSWRAMQSFDRAARVVFSIACSTGTSHLVGLGERLGLFGALRRAGTAAVVAPRWDVYPELVLPILDDTIERYMAGAPLARALNEAAVGAGPDVPDWLRWSLTVEGDWR